MNRFPALLLIAVMPMISQGPVIRAGVDFVVVPATVRDTNGAFIYGLMKEQFQIFEDGKPQEIRGFAAESRPLSVVLLIDTGIDGPSLGRIAASHRSLKAAFKNGDEVEMYRFDHVFDKIFDFTPSPIEFEKKMVTIKSIGDRAANRPTSLPILPGRGPTWLRRILMLDAGIDYKNLNDLWFTTAELPFTNVSAMMLERFAAVPIRFAAVPEAFAMMLEAPATMLERPAAVPIRFAAVPNTFAMMPVASATWTEIVATFIAFVATWIEPVATWIVSSATMVASVATWIESAATSSDSLVMAAGLSLRGSACVYSWH